MERDTFMDFLEAWEAYLDGRLTYDEVNAHPYPKRRRSPADADAAPADAHYGPPTAFPQERTRPRPRLLWRALSHVVGWFYEPPIPTARVVRR